MITYHENLKYNTIINRYLVTVVQDYTVYIPKCSVCNVYLIIILKASARLCITIIKYATALKVEKVIKMSDCKATFLLLSTIII